MLWNTVVQASIIISPILFAMNRVKSWYRIGSSPTCHYDFSSNELNSWIKRPTSVCCQEIWTHNRLYYIEHAPQISDEAYDHLVKRLEAIEREHPDWTSSTSPTQQVNEALTRGFASVRHQTPMLSLANTYSSEEIEAFLQRMIKLVEKNALTFTVELKMDGIAVSVRYEKGVLTRGVTRGNGWEGDDITANIRMVSNLPHQILGPNVPDILEVRGEVYMPRDVFQANNVQKVQEGESPWANPRNAAAGSLKLLDPRLVAKRRLAIAFYGLAEESTIPLKNQSEIAPYLQQLGLPTVDYIAHCHSFEEIWQFTEQVRQLRPTFAL